MNKYINKILKNKIIDKIFKYEDLHKFINNINNYNNNYKSIIIILGLYMGSYFKDTINIINLPNLLIYILIALKIININGQLIFRIILTENIVILKIIYLLNKYFDKIKYKISKTINQLNILFIICKKRNKNIYNFDEYKNNIKELYNNNIIIFDIFEKNKLYIKDINIEIKEEILIIKKIKEEYKQEEIKIKEMKYLYKNNEELYDIKFKNNMNKIINYYI